MRKWHWCCAITGVAALGVFGMAMYCKSHPDAPVTRAVAAACEMGLRSTPLAGLQSAPPGAEDSLPDGVPPDPVPWTEGKPALKEVVENAYPDNELEVPPTLVVREDDDLKEPVAVANEKKEPERPEGSVVASEWLNVPKPSAAHDEMPKRMPYCDEGIVLAARMPYADEDMPIAQMACVVDSDHAVTPGSSCCIAGIWMKLFTSDNPSGDCCHEDSKEANNSKESSQPKCDECPTLWRMFMNILTGGQPAADVEEDMDPADPLPEPECLDDPLYSEHYQSCPHAAVCPYCGKSCQDAEMEQKAEPAKESEEQGGEGYLLPPEVREKRRSEMKTIPLSLLRQEPVDVYRLAPGDVLGVYIEGVLGEKTQGPPVHISESGNRSPSLGYPISVRADGTLPLPLVEPIKIAGLSVTEAQEKVKQAYILLEESEKVIVTLMKPRSVHVVVVRQDSVGLPGGQLNGLTCKTHHGAAYELDLPAYENDILNALSRTGGLPGLDSKDEVRVLRGVLKDKKSDDTCVKGVINGCLRSFENARTTCIPLRLSPAEEVPFKPEDILLEDGDMVVVEARDFETYQTGGLLPAKTFDLPNDYDLDIVEAISLAIPSVGNSGSLEPLAGSAVTVLRQMPNEGVTAIHINLRKALQDARERILVRNGDTIILQTHGEALTRYISDGVWMQDLLQKCVECEDSWARFVKPLLDQPEKGDAEEQSEPPQSEKAAPAPHRHAVQQRPAFPTIDTMEYRPSDRTWNELGGPDVL